MTSSYEVTHEFTINPYLSENDSLEYNRQWGFSSGCCHVFWTILNSQNDLMESSLQWNEETSKAVAQVCACGSFSCFMNRPSLSQSVCVFHFLSLSHAIKLHTFPFAVEAPAHTHSNKPVSFLVFPYHTFVIINLYFEGSEGLYWSTKSNIRNQRLWTRERHRWEAPTLLRSVVLRYKT